MLVALQEVPAAMGGFNVVPFCSVDVKPVEVVTEADSESGTESLRVFPGGKAGREVIPGTHLKCSRSERAAPGSMVPLCRSHPTLGAGAAPELSSHLGPISQNSP